MFHFYFTPSCCPSPWALLLKPLAYSILVSQFTLCQIKRAQYYCLLGVGGRLQHDEAGHARLEGEGQVGQLELQEGDDQVSLSIYKRDSFTWKRDHLFQGGRHETIYWVCEAAVWETRQKVLKRLFVYWRIGRRQIKNAVLKKKMLQNYKCYIVTSVCQVVTRISRQTEVWRWFRSWTVYWK